MQSDAPDKANIIALPPLIYAAAFVVGWLIHLAFPVPVLPDKPARVIGVLFVLVSFSHRHNRLTCATAGTDHLRYDETDDRHCHGWTISLQPKSAVCFIDVALSRRGVAHQRCLDDGGTLQT